MKRIHIQEKSKGLKRLTYSSLVAGVATIVAVAAMTTPALAAKYNIKIAVTTPPGYSYNVGLEQFKKDVEDGSSGDISVTIFPSAQLGNEVESGKNVQLGTLEMTVISASNLSPFYEKLVTKHV